ncbi:hypothetical protein BJ978_002203 [Agromyces terreus]|uniref:DUF2207 domain-containing protein n=1 Tax=Agromyces terreus TaxID=424795 RepID=A0A9X2GZI6_9MICO|nr:hypothetical protein [Agromyces terreus]MCP2371527.1 hypothetical protein [Agromyces terreus]
MTRQDRPDDESAPDRSAAAGAMPAEAIADERPRHTPLWSLLSGWLLGLEAWLRSHGGRGLRRGIRVFWAAVAAAGVWLLIGPVINAPLTLDDITSSAGSATDDWIAREFAADYRISRDDDGRLRAEVEERIDAFFPHDVDETGIERVLATEYEGHALEPSAISAELDGEPVAVEIERGPTTLTVAIDAGERLTGDHDVVLRYRMQDLAYPADDEATGTTVDLLEWDVFGPSWPQAFAGLDVAITMPDELADELIRPPRGALAWLLVGGGEWLEPEADSPAGSTTFRLVNDQNIPPHAQAWFTMSFESGTFTMPPNSPWFIVQTFGPVVPLVLLAVALLFALAARAVAWADARGRPWFLARHDPPDTSPAIAAHVLGAPLAMELAVSLDRIPSKPVRGVEGRAQRIDAARAARRTGRLGNLPRALARYWFGAERRAVVADGLRRVPRGFVRDAFLAAPPALMLVQWGLVRQLSHQTTLSIVWWPVAFVLVSTVLAALVMWIAWSSRPLTRRGALLKQDLLGVEVYAERTQLLDRGPATDPAMPYAVLGGDAGSSGRRVGALLEAELGDVELAKGWQTPGYLGWARLLVIGASVLLLPAMIVLMARVPNPYDTYREYAAYDQDVPGTLWTNVESADIVGELTRGADGAAVVEVTERYTVAFDDSSSQVPQFANQWPDLVDGQSLGLRVDAVRLDGADAPYLTTRDGDTLLMRTAFTEVLSGTHDLEIDYTLGSAAFAVPGDDGGPRSGPIVDRVRWAALIEDWHYSGLWRDPETHEFAPTRVEFRIGEELSALALQSGWITLDTSGDGPAAQWPETVVPFGEVDGGYPGVELSEHGTEETVDESDGELTASLALEDTEYGLPLQITADDLGVRLDFPAGTFTGPDERAMHESRAIAALPFTVVLGLELLAIAIGAAGILVGLRRAPMGFRRGVFRDLLVWTAPLATLTAFVGFVWLTGDIPADHPVIPQIGWPLLVAAVTTVAALVLTRRGRAPGAPRRSKARAGSASTPKGRS